MRKTAIILFLCTSLMSLGQQDSSSIEDILSKLHKLEKQKISNDTVSSIKVITDKSYATSLDQKENAVNEEKIPGVVSEDKDTIEPKKAKKFDGPIITFEADSLDVGSIVQGDVIKRKFVFKNTGTKKLYVTQIVVDCGCTEPEWTQDAIQPGEEGHIIATYDSKDDAGRFQKLLTVVHNGQDYSYLMLTGFVAPKL